MSDGEWVLPDDMTAFETAIVAAAAVGSRVAKSLALHTAIQSLHEQERKSVETLGAPTYWEVASLSVKWSDLCVSPVGDA